MCAKSVKENEYEADVSLTKENKRHQLDAVCKSPPVVVRRGGLLTFYSYSFSNPTSLVTTSLWSFHVFFFFTLFTDMC